MKYRSESNRITTIFLLCIVTCACFLSACNSRQQTQQAPPPPEVVTMTVKEQSVVLTTELPGRTSACLVAEVRPQVSGIIQKRLFTEGARVKAGEVLYQIDPAPFKAAYDSARASLARAQANLPAIKSRAQRYQELSGTKAVSQQDIADTSAALGQAEAEVTYWQAALDAARINLGYTQVRASISGRIGKSAVTQGALVTAGQPTPLATIQQIDPIYVDVPRSTAQLLRLRHSVEGGALNQEGAGQRKVKIILEDGTPYPLEGTMQFQDITVDRSTGSVTVRAVFPNPDEVLLPGMFVRGIAREGVNSKAILVPQPSVARDPKGNPYVLLVNAVGKVEQREISIDRAMGNQWLVATGLKPGERVIIEGIQKAKPGSPVKAVASEAAASEGSTPEPAHGAAAPAK